jgi:hypothetical protein
MTNGWPWEIWQTSRQWRPPLTWFYIVLKNEVYLCTTTRNNMIFQMYRINYGTVGTLLTALNCN